ncbi:MAG: aminoacyl-tRNA hydrolase [Bacteroidetes bacterium 4484_249]|nr:MAG: aminoacyl-tRNA hydrolase [Bacteroidetes bacterium 4484_249]
MKYLITGLGNIGDEYANTRHNIGFIVADALAQDGKATFESGRYGDMAKIKFKARTLLILKPSTFMNLSGKAIKYWLNKENIPTEKLLVVTDDIALPTGTLRLRSKGGDGGHNGLMSIIENIGTSDFPRLRIGIGGDFPKGYQVDYVLGKWTKTEEEIMIPKVKDAVEIIKSFATIGIERTMNIYNKKK